MRDAGPMTDVFTTHALRITTGSGETVHDLTAECDAFLREAADGRDGLLNVFVPHATAGIALIETGAGSDDDLLAALHDLLPADDRWNHRHGSPGHGRDHVLPALVPPHATLPVIGGSTGAGHLAVGGAGRHQPRQPAAQRAAVVPRLSAVLPAGAPRADGRGLPRDFAERLPRPERLGLPAAFRLAGWAAGRGARSRWSPAPRYGPRPGSVRSSSPYWPWPPWCSVSAKLADATQTRPHERPTAAATTVVFEIAVRGSADAAAAGWPRTTCGRAAAARPAYPRTTPR